MGAIESTVAMNARHSPRVPLIDAAVY